MPARSHGEVVIDSVVSHHRFHGLPWMYLRADASGDQENEMVSAITPTQFENLKREAKRRKRASASLSHSAALDEIALEHGYANWSLLAKSINAEPTTIVDSRPVALIPRDHVVRVSGWVRSSGSERWADQFWHHYLPTKHPASYYTKCRRIPENWDVVKRSAESVVEGLKSVQRVLAFMDATDLRPSTAFNSLFPSDIRHVGLDHFCVWRDSSNRYVVSNEPYGPSAKVEATKRWCEVNGWTYREMPRDVGMHNPCTANCSEGCYEHTVLILMSPPKRGGDLVNVGDALASNFHALNSTKIAPPEPKLSKVS